MWEGHYFVGARLGLYPKAKVKPSRVVVVTVLCECECVCVEGGVKTMGWIGRRIIRFKCRFREFPPLSKVTPKLESDLSVLDSHPLLFTRHYLPSSNFTSSLLGRVCACSVAQSCSTLCDPMDCSLPGSTVHGVLQARILKWVAIPFSRGSSPLRDGTLVL